jgi:hypothetical protein
MTGVKLDLEAQLRRRTLFVDLFTQQSARDRKIPDDALMITTSFIRNEEMRKKLLSAMWGLMREWDDSGRPKTPHRALESFEEWSALVPSIVSGVGFSNCLAPFVAPDAGDTRTQEFKDLSEALIREHCIKPKKEMAMVTMRDIIRAARLNGLFGAVLWTLEQVISELDSSSKFKYKFEDREGRPLLDADGNPKLNESELTDAEKADQAAEWSNQSINSTWGKAFKAGAVDGLWHEIDGKFWEFGDRGSSKRSQFKLRLVPEDEL